MSLAEYAASLVSLAALAALAGLVSYSGGEDRGHRFAISVILLYAAIVPLVPLVSELSNIDFSDITGSELPELSGGAYLEKSEEAFEEGIRRLVSEKWGVDETKIIVSVSGFDFETMTARKIKITLLGKGVGIDFREVKKYIENNGLGECEVGYAFE